MPGSAMSAGSAACAICWRATYAPGQTCGPRENARWRTVARRRSKRSGSSQWRSSRLAEAIRTPIRAPAGKVHAAELGVLVEHARVHPDRRGPAQALLGRVGQVLRILARQGLLLGVGEQRVQRGGDDIAR